MALHQRAVSGIGTFHIYEATVGAIMLILPTEDKAVLSVDTSSVWRRLRHACMLSAHHTTLRLCPFCETRSEPKAINMEDSMALTFPTGVTQHPIPETMRSA